MVSISFASIVKKSHLHIALFPMGLLSAEIAHLFTDKHLDSTSAMSSQSKGLIGMTISYKVSQKASEATGLSMTY